MIPEKFTQYFGDLYVFCTFVDTSRANKRFASCSKQIHSCRLDSHLQTWILYAESQPARWSSSTSPPVQLNQPSSPAQPAAHRSSSTCPPVQLNPPPRRSSSNDNTIRRNHLYPESTPIYKLYPSTCNYLSLYSPDWTHVEYICRFNLAIHLL